MRPIKRRTRRLLLLITVLVASGVALGILILVRGARRAHQAEVAREAGMSAYAMGEYETALDELPRALSRNTNDTEALLALGDSRSRVFQAHNAHLGAAVGLYKQVLALDPDNAEALSALLDLYGTLGLNTEWVDMADRILLEFPDHIDALEAKANVEYRNGRYDEAIEITRRLSELQPQELSWRAMSIDVMRARGEGDQTILRTIDQWIETSEQDGMFRLLKSRLLAETGDLDAARDELIIAARRGANSLPVLDRMLVLLESLDLQDETTALLAAAKVKFPDEPWVYEAAIQRLWRSSRLDEALAELNQAQQALGRVDRQLLRWKALIHAARDENAEAREAVGELRKRASDPQNREHEADRAWAEAIGIGLDADDATWTDSVLAYERAIALSPRDAILPFLLAQIYQRVGEHDLAVACFQRVVELDPGWQDGRIALAESLLVASRPTEALKVLAASIQQGSRAGAQTYRLLARAWLESGDAVARTQVRMRVDLLDLLETLYEEAPRDTEIPSMLAEAYLRKGMVSDAQGLLDRTLESADDGRTLQLLAEVSARWHLGWEESLFTRAVALDGSTMTLAAARAQVLVREGRVDEALAVIDAAIRDAADPDQAAIDARPVRLELMLAGEDQDAIAGMGDWLDSEPDSLDAATFILDHEHAWEDQELIQRATDVLERHLGESAPQVKLARARFAYRFQADTPARIADAIVLVATVMERTPDSRAALTLMASLMLLSADPPYEQVVGYLKRAVGLHPSDGVLYPQLIALLQRQGAFDIADRYLSRLAALADVAPHLRPVALELLEKQGDFERAIAHLGTWVDSNSPVSEQLELARLLTIAGRYADAESIYHQVLQGPGYDEVSAVAAANFFAATGRFERGRQVLVELDGDACAKEIALAGFYQRFGLEDEAALHLRRATELDPTQPDPWATIADLRLARGEIAEAHQATLKGLQLDPDAPELQMMLAVVSMSLGETGRGEAIAILEERGPSHPGLLPTVRLFDRIASSGERTEVAERDLADARQLVDDHPDFLPAWRIAITLHVQADRIDEAIRLARQATGRLPAEPDPPRMACMLLTGVDRTEEALAMARLWRRRSPADPLPVEFTIATLLLDLDRPAEALRPLDGYRDRIWAERNHHPDRIEIWLGALFESGRVDEAMTFVESLLGESGVWGEQCLRVATRLGERSARRLISTIEPALAPEPAGRLQVADAWLNLAKRFDDAAAYEHAGALAETVLVEPAHAVRVRFLLAEIARRRDDLTLSEEHYRSILSRRADDIAALNNLADVLVRQGSRCNEAVDLAARAAGLAGGNPSVLDTLAQALLCQGRYADAEQQIRASLRAQPTNPSFLLTLASILQAQGRVDEARAALSTARQSLASIKWPEADLLRRVEALTVGLREQP